MPQVLRVAACELGDPYALLVLMEADDRLRNGMHIRSWCSAVSVSKAA